MNIVLSDLLQSRSVNRVVEAWIAFARSVEENVSNLAMLQFFIHAMHRRYVLTVQDVQEIDNDIEFSETARRIYRSASIECDEELMMDNVQAFVERLVDETFANNLLHPALTTWIQFLYRIITNVHTKNACKARAIHLASLFLAPLCCIKAKILSSREPDTSVQTLRAISDGIDVILKMLPLGFGLTPCRVEVSAIFVNAMESWSGVLNCRSKDYLHIYLDMLNHEVDSLKANALRSLRKLCYIPWIRPLLAATFMLRSSCGVSFMDVLQDQFKHKHLRLDIIELLTAMGKQQEFDRESFSREFRDKIYPSVFATNQNLVYAVAAVMKVFGDDFWTEVLKKPSIRNWKSFISRVPCEYSDPNIIKRIILSDESAQIANPELVVILVGLMKKSALRFDNIGSVNSSVILDLGFILERCLSSEKAFMNALKIVDVDRGLMIRVFRHKQHQEILKDIIFMVSKGFVEYKNQASLHNIVATLKKLSELSLGAEIVLHSVKNIFAECYIDYKDMVLSKDDSPTVAQAESVVKLEILLGESSFNIISTCSMRYFYRLSLGMLSRLNHQLASICIRIHSNFLKHLWHRMVNNRWLTESLPFNDQELVDGIEQFMMRFRNINDDSLFYTLRSFMDLCVCFQPIMRDNHDHPIFSMWSFPLLADTVEELARIVEDQVFQKSDASNDGTGSFHRTMILQSWSDLIREYKTLPKTQASRSIISHYSRKSPFKSDLERVLNSLMFHKNMFEETVAMSILDMSNQGDFMTLRTFLHELEDFLCKSRGKFQIRMFVVEIWSNILRKLKQNVDSSVKAGGNNRLKVLKFSSWITKFVNDTGKRKLESRTADLIKSDLTERERNTLDAFRTVLQEERSFD